MLIYFISLWKLGFKTIQ